MSYLARWNAVQAKLRSGATDTDRAEAMKLMTDPDFMKGLQTETAAQATVVVPPVTEDLNKGVAGQCSKCSAKSLPGAKFCPECGGTISKAVATQEETPKPPVVPSQGDMAKSIADALGTGVEDLDGMFNVFPVLDAMQKSFNGMAASMAEVVTYQERTLKAVHQAHLRMDALEGKIEKGLAGAGGGGGTTMDSALLQRMGTIETMLFGQTPNPQAANPLGKSVNMGGGGGGAKLGKTKVIELLQKGLRTQDLDEDAFCKATRLCDYNDPTEVLKEAYPAGYNEYMQANGAG